MMENGQGQRGDYSGRNIAQEQEDDGDHQAQRQEHGEFDVLIGFANGVGTVVENVHLDRWGQLALERRDQLLDVVGYFDGVGAGLPLNGQYDRTLDVVGGVKPGGGLVVFDAVEQCAQFLQPHGRAVAIGHHQGSVLIGAGQLPRGLQSKRALRAGDLSGGKIDVPGFQRVFNFVDADLVRGQRMRVHLDVDGVFLRAQHLYLRDAGDHGDALSDARFRVLVQGVQRHHLGGQRDVENRLIGGVHLGEGRRRRHALREQAGGLGDGCLHVDGGSVEASVEVEFQGDLGRARASSPTSWTQCRRWWRTDFQEAWRRRRPWSPGLRRGGWPSPGEWGSRRWAGRLRGERDRLPFRRVRSPPSEGWWRWAA